MKKLLLTEDIHQSNLIPFEDDFITLEMKFIENCWFANVSFKGKVINGIRLVSGVLLLSGMNFPFELLIDDKGLELDPFALDSFTSEVFDLLLLDRSEITALRGYEVP
jgi:hypothetical protein